MGYTFYETFTTSCVYSTVLPPGSELEGKKLSCPSRGPRNQSAYTPLPKWLNRQDLKSLYPDKDLLQTTMLPSQSEANALNTPLCAGEKKFMRWQSWKGVGIQQGRFDRSFANNSLIVSFQSQAGARHWSRDVVIAKPNKRRSVPLVFAIKGRYRYAGKFAPGAGVVSLIELFKKKVQVICRLNWSSVRRTGHR